MFEKISRLAERAANNISVSRRGFLGRLGQGALAVGAVLGGFATSAAGQSSGVVCCYYWPKNMYKFKPKTVCQKAGTTCAPTIDSGTYFLQSSSTAASCKNC